MIIVHIARINLSYESGMGRIASNWKTAFLLCGHEFYHIGSDEVDRNIHNKVWGFFAKKYIRKLQIKPDIVLVHEPVGAFFISKNFKTVIYSHGIEERAWQVQQKYKFISLSIKSQILPNWLRFFSNNIGFKKADKILLSNMEDVSFLNIEKKISSSKIEVFKNGYYPFIISNNIKDEVVFLYNATWIGRKGIDLMYKVFNTVLKNYPSTKLIIAGTVYGIKDVLRGFDKNVHEQIQVIPFFTNSEEIGLYQQSNVFVMPSYFEGQSVALTQAMAMGLCPVTANNCGQKDFITDRVNGLLFETGNSKDFENQLEWLVNNTKKIKEFGEKAKEFVKDLTWEKVSQDVVNSTLKNFA